MAVAALKKKLSKRLGFKPNILVALAAFWVNFCLLGVLRSNAVIYRALVDVFHVKREDAAWPSGIFGFFMCVTGALSGFLTHHISVRNLAVLGAILASVSVSTCSLASEMQHIVYLYGALQGIGVGIIVPLTHVVLNRSFTKYRAFALGIAYSGSSLGSFVFPPVTNVLLYTYGLDGTFLLLGSIMLNSLVGAILFNSSNPEKEKENKQFNSQSSAVCESSDKQKGSCIVQYNFIKYESSLKNKGRLDGKHFQPVLNRSATDQALCLDKEERGKLCGPKRCCKVMPSFKMAIEILSSPHFLIVSAAYAVYFSTSAIFLMVVMDFAKGASIPKIVSTWFLHSLSETLLGV
ncbi:unnamed protein product [Larinioides sclopetarius]|uniref:Major facilitator superfamily (MFS) profile domain-containing protein n=1 Tax=Larinioides sclopetarius TaxID=280406 RepID=A0AAV2A465_9ARAC